MALPQLAVKASGLADFASDLAGWASGMAGWASGLAGWASDLASWGSDLTWLDGPEGAGRMYGRMYKQRKENLSILQNFVPYWDRCPIKSHFEINEEGKGTADHWMPLGGWLSFNYSFI